MKSITKGWVVINNNHPSGVGPYIVTSTFSEYRSLAIQEFVKGSGFTWEYWRDKFNFRCVRAEQTISITSK